MTGQQGIQPRAESQFENAELFIAKKGTEAIFDEDVLRLASGAMQ